MKLKFNVKKLRKAWNDRAALEFKQALLKCSMGCSVPYIPIRITNKEMSEEFLYD